MRALALILALSACGDNQAPPPVAPVPDATPDAQVAPPLASCVDRPTDLPRPPTGQLTCDLLPPGMVL